MTPAAPAAPVPWAARDVREIVETALHHEGHLLAAGEAYVARTLAALPDGPLELYARLVARVGPVFRVAGLRYDLDVPAAIAALDVAGLVYRALPPDRCVGAFDLPALREACKRLGLPVGGRRAEVVERLAGTRWVTEAVVMPAHAGLLARLERLCFQRAWVDRRVLVLERLGAVKWAEYTPTGGVGLHRDRRAMLRWERGAAGAWDEGEALAVALAGRDEDRDGTLSPWRRAIATVLEADPDLDALLALHAAGAPVAPRLALALERAGRIPDALDVCRTAIGAGAAVGAGTADAEAAVALARTGARLARRLGRSFPPSSLREPPRRVLRLPPAPRADGDPRPRWTVPTDDGPADLPVEAAVLACLRAAGRAAVFAENTLWTSLYALVLRDLYFLPVPGMLPTARRDGPLDVGRPGFYARRRDAIEARLAAVRQRGPAPFVAGWAGERLAGLARPDVVLAVADAIPGPMAAAVIVHLAREGWSAAAGLPDLLVLPGPATPLPAALPSRLPESAFLAEIKGPGDSVRDGQRVWHARLLDSDIPVELWAVGGSS